MQLAARARSPVTSFYLRIIMLRSSSARALSTSFALAAFLAPTALSQGMLFTSTNAASGNSVQAFTRDAQAHLITLPPVATNGMGSGSGLGSQGAVALSQDLQWLFVVNAGSDDVSVFRVTPSGPVFTDIEPSGGTHPVSVTTHGDLVYVVNGGAPNNVSGFRLSMAGVLTPIAGSTHALTAISTNPGQVQLSPTGDQLLVTEKGTDQIDAFPVGTNGDLGSLTHFASGGQEPFGLAFQGSNHLIVSETANGAAGGSSASSYQFNSGSWTAVSSAVPTLQTSACWVAISKDGHYAYTANTGSGSISGFSMTSSGNLTLLTPGGVTATTGSMPTDIAFSYRSRYLYVLNSGAGTISSFARSANGSLTPVETGVGTLPSSAAGLVAF
jgi:6-phosphogluconolactonase